MINARNLAPLYLSIKFPSFRNEAFVWRIPALGRLTGCRLRCFSSSCTHKILHVFQISRPVRNSLINRNHHHLNTWGIAHLSNLSRRSCFQTLLERSDPVWARFFDLLRLSDTWESFSRWNWLGLSETPAVSYVITTY